METIPTIHDLTLPRHLTYDTMLVLPKMDPTHHASRSVSLPRAFLRHTINAITRLSILLLKVVGTAIAMFLVPRIIHIMVQCFDNLYDMLGRRAHSPWETQTLWGYGALAALAIMIILHDLLFRLSNNVILNEDIEMEWAKQKKHGYRTWKERKVTWERILARLVIPGSVIGGLCVMAWRVVWVMGGADVRELVRANTVDLEDDARAGLVWRDR
ncbi:hypothetical protein BU25DRAFT_26109 [Macroventuria anomochaeta]|uniref:Uncharacterized protein n=1 Tax=Macroventuria anomochaeta TaxID=301207 RepID=A0ACB6S760_9PLEO|nr:uncharacterized protein BU25DRAFT_26109 [Macroventuria anomochaeta]KAF2629049.1 hypothetical protein BU25DRAFT_26109 [Macroventuria anomochaeta]